MSSFNPAAATDTPLDAVNPNVNAPDFIGNFAAIIDKSSILVPNGVAQIGSFAFDYREIEEVELEAEVTDHYLEDNTAAHDHIAVRPTRVTLSGFVAELNLPASTLKTILGVLTAATNALQQLPIFLGPQTAGNAQALEQAISQVQSAAVTIGQTIARAAQLANILGGLLSGPARNRQQQAYLQLKAYQKAGIIFTVVTPYETLTNMAIVSIRAIDPEDSIYWSKFTVRMKQLQFVGVLSDTNYAANLSSPVASAQGQAPTTLGATAGAALSAAGQALTTANVFVVPTNFLATP